MGGRYLCTGHFSPGTHPGPSNPHRPAPSLYCAGSAPAGAAGNLQTGHGQRAQSFLRDAVMFISDTHTAEQHQKPQHCNSVFKVAKDRHQMCGGRSESNLNILVTLDYTSVLFIA